ncbi:MAG: DASS family sodium-coupled anion symporter [Candidatus Heimdallarchaeota archaeon]|nr:DASS family sodium-coupled anion symporter [Candidatus Heimdallarchaeota archaeon]
MSSSVLLPEDIAKFDIDKTDEPPEGFISEGDLPSKRQIILTVLTILVFISGYMIAPDPLEEGRYSVSLQYKDEKIVFDIDISDRISEVKDYTSISSTNENGLLVARYYKSYPSESGTVFQFELDVNYHNLESISINSFKGKISNDDLSHSFIAKFAEDNTAIFEFTILRDTRVGLGLLFAVSFLWLTELVPLAATSLMIPVVLVLWNEETAANALSQFSAPIIFLFLAGFLMAEAMKRSKLDIYISYKIFAMIPPNGKILMFSMMCLSAVFSMFMSNTASTAILIPITLQLLKGVNIENAQYKKAVILGIAYAAAIGGVGSMIGTPPNIIAVEMLHQFDPSIEISFVDWFLFGLPIVIIMLPITFTYLWYVYKPVVDEERLKEAKVFVKIRLEEEHRFTFDQVVVTSIFVLIFGLWLTSNIHGISAGIIALLGAVLLFFSGQLKESDLRRINWNALLTFGGGLTLGAMIINTGLADYIGSKAGFISPLPKILIIFCIGAITLIMTAFASNTASAVILIPIVMPLSYVLGLSPILLAIIVATTASIDFAIVVGTPPTMMAYSTKLYSTEEIFRIGVVLDIIGLFVVTLLSWFLFINLIDLV